MSDLQLGLLAIGVLLVVGVLAYNWRQESVARRTAESAPRSRRAEAPTLPEPPRTAAASPEKPVHSAHRTPTAPVAGLPDPHVDYVVELAFASPLAANELVRQWKGNEHRYASRVILACNGGGAGWRRLSTDDLAAVDSLQAGLQLVRRDGPVSDAELIEFRAALETIAAATGASVSAPEIRAAAETARDLDEFCADSDIQVVLHVVAPSGSALSEARIRPSAEAAGLVADEGGRMVLRDANGQRLYTLGSLDADQPTAVSLTLDVPRVADFPRVFQSMARFAAQLAAELGGDLRDDNGNPLEERSLRAIGAQLDTVQAGFDSRGISPGSESALRLFL